MLVLSLAPHASAAESNTPVKTGIKQVALISSKPILIKKETYEVKPFDSTVSHDLVKQKSKMGNYELYSELVDGNLNQLKVSVGGKTVLQKSLPRPQGASEPSFSIMDPAKDTRVNEKPVARDMNNDGIPELFILQDGGGPRGPLEVSIYQLDGKSAKEIYKAGIDISEIKDIDGNGSYEFTVYDRPMDGFHGSGGAESWSHKVVLAWNGSTYVPSAKLMAEKAPDAAAFKSALEEMNKSIKTQEESMEKLPAKTKAATAAVWGQMTRWIYSGNIKTARKLFDLLYPADTKLAIAEYEKKPIIQSREQFWQDFEAQLVKGSYYPNLAKQLLTKN